MKALRKVLSGIFPSLKYSKHKLHGHVVDYTARKQYIYDLYGYDMFKDEWLLIDRTNSADKSNDWFKKYEMESIDYDDKPNSLKKEIPKMEVLTKPAIAETPEPVKTSK